MSSSVAARGRFVVLEGTDGAGSTSQGDLLSERLRALGYEVVRTAQPSALEGGVLLRRILRGEVADVGAATVALLFAADRLDHWRRVVRPALERGAFVVCDRHLASSLAFQVVDGDGGIDAAWISEINRHAPTADLTLWCDVPVETAMQRIEARGKPLERFEVSETLQRVRQRYAAIFAAPPTSLGPSARIDATGSVEQVAALVWQVVADHKLLDVRSDAKRGNLQGPATAEDPHT